MAPVWNVTSDRDLLLKVIDVATVGKVDWDKVSSRMAEDGYNFTASSCSQHFRKIKIAAGQNDVGGQSANIPGSSSAKKNKSKAKDFANKDDEEDTPSKKRKVVKADRAKDIAKAEAEDRLPLFKQEWKQGDPPIDLEDDNIYD